MAIELIVAIAYTGYDVQDKREWAEKCDFRSTSGSEIQESKV
jgi:hypothetical protein